MINWQKVTLNLRQHYKPLGTVAKKVGSDWAHLCRLARGFAQSLNYWKTMKKPVLTAKQMADFLMHHYSPTVTENVRNDYRRRSLELFEQIHEPSYAKEVRRLLEQMFRESKKKNVKAKK